MKIQQIILEKIEAPLYQIARDAILKKLPEWAEYIFEHDIKPLLDPSIFKKQKYYLNLYKKNNDIESYENSQNYQIKIYDKIHEILWFSDKEKDEKYDHIISTFKYTIENVLQNVIKSYIENMFGKIEMYSPGSLYSDVKQKNLYWLRYIIVDIDINAKFKSGKPKTSGGFFSENPEYHFKNVDKGLIGQGIKIFADGNKLWEAARDYIIYYFSKKFFGESEPPYSLENFLSNILPTFVHETTHLEQRTRKYLSKGSGYNYGISYTPEKKKRNPNKNIGNRGHPSRLQNEENIDDLEWIEYFGTDHEIEAHAASAAASIIHNMYAHDPDIKQYQINNDIDSVIKDLQSGIFPSEAYSLLSYENYFKNLALKMLRYRKWKDERTINKINIGARKVWTIFLKKVIKHLLSYKKSNPEYNPKYRLPYPINKPNLPS
jgi:hypothetical protein